MINKRLEDLREVMRREHLAACSHGDRCLGIPRCLATTLIAYQLTAKSQVGVDYRGQNTVKFVQNEKYSAKSADFLRFYLYLCHVIDDFACLDLQH